MVFLADCPESLNKGVLLFWGSIGSRSRLTGEWNRNKSYRHISGFATYTSGILSKVFARSL